MDTLHSLFDATHTDNPHVFLSYLYNGVMTHLETNENNTELERQIITSFTRYSITTDSTIRKVFNFSEIIFNQSRVKLMQMLEKGIFIVKNNDILPNAWETVKNNSLLEYGYKQYIQAFKENISAHNRPQLFVLAQEFAGIGGVHKHYGLAETLKTDLNKKLSTYSQGFWIRKHRQESAKALQHAIKKTSNYQDILSEIQSTYQEVMANDATKEVGMHRHGSSRYYNTLNELEDMVVTAWAQDENAIHSLNEYVTSYEKGVNEAFTHYMTALKDPKFAYNKDFSKHDLKMDSYKPVVLAKLLTANPKFPGYIHALSREVKTRWDCLQKYNDILDKSPRDTVYPL